MYAHGAMEESAFPDEYYMDPSTSIKDRVFFAARDGLSLTLFNLLYEKKNDEIEELLNQEVKHKGAICTPLIAAARNGREAVVKIILEKFGTFVKLEQTGTVCFDNYIIEGATALWCAAAAGHLKVIKRLVKAGADVNHATTVGSTPLRAACFDGRLDIVRYLYRHNADIHKANLFNNSCLMIAAYKGHLPVVQFLLESGAHVEERALCNATALHFAAECGYPEVTEALLDQGATQTNNESGMIPLMCAAERTRDAVVELMAARGNLPREQIINAYELLGASFANDKDNYCLINAYKYLHKAMLMRWDEEHGVIPKEPFPPIPAYDNWKEALTIEDITRLQGNADGLHMEGLCVRERLLGRCPELLQPIVYRGAVLADNSQFLKCLNLWYHALEINMERKDPVAKDLLRFAQVFSQMLYADVRVELSQVNIVLEACSEELRRLDGRIIRPTGHQDSETLKEEREQNIHTSLYLISIAAKLVHMPSHRQSDISALKKTHEIVARFKEVAITTNRRKMLHMAVSFDTSIDDFHTSHVCKYPCIWTTKLLINSGFDVDALDTECRTPLLLALVSSEHAESSESNCESLCGVVCELISGGAHTDLVDVNLITPLCASIGGPAEPLIRASLQLNLMCLSASSLAKIWKTYNPKTIPWPIHKLLELHGIRKQNDR